MVGLVAAIAVAPSVVSGFQDAPLSFAVYALSRGAGVPKPTREALDRIRGLLDESTRESGATDPSETRIGLEGEVRLCVEFDDRAAGERALAEVRRMAEGVELMNVVVEPCPLK
jgi:hypothetical protein